MNYSVTVTVECEGKEVARGTYPAKVTAGECVYVGWQTMSGAMPFGAQVTLSTKKFPEGLKAQWLELEAESLARARQARADYESGKGKSGNAGAVADLRALFAPLAPPAVSADLLSNPVISAALQPPPAKFAKPVTITAGVDKLVKEGKVSADEAESFQSLCNEYPTKTAREVYNELRAGKAGKAKAKA